MIYVVMGFIFILTILILYSQYKDQQLEDIDLLLRGYMIKELNLLLKDIARHWREDDRNWRNLLVVRYNDKLFLYKKRYGENETFYAMQDKLNMILEKQEKRWGLNKNGQE